MRGSLAPVHAWTIRLPSLLELRHRCFRGTCIKQRVKCGTSIPHSETAAECRESRAVSAEAGSGPCVPVRTILCLFVVAPRCRDPSCLSRQTRRRGRTPSRTYFFDATDRWALAVDLEPTWCGWNEVLHVVSAQGKVTGGSGQRQQFPSVCRSRGSLKPMEVSHIGNAVSPSGDGRICSLDGPIH